MAKILTGPLESGESLREASHRITLARAGVNIRRPRADTRSAFWTTVTEPTDLTHARPAGELSFVCAAVGVDVQQFATPLPRTDGFGFCWVEPGQLRLNGGAPGDGLIQLDQQEAASIKAAIGSVRDYFERPRAG